MMMEAARRTRDRCGKRAEDPFSGEDSRIRRDPTHQEGDRTGRLGRKNTLCRTRDHINDSGGDV